MIFIQDDITLRKFLYNEGNKTQNFATIIINCPFLIIYMCYDLKCLNLYIIQFRDQKKICILSLWWFVGTASQVGLFINTLTDTCIYRSPIFQIDLV